MVAPKTSTDAAAWNLSAVRHAGASLRCGVWCVVWCVVCGVVWCGVPRYGYIGMGEFGVGRAGMMGALIVDVHGSCEQLTKKRWCTLVRSADLLSSFFDSDVPAVAEWNGMERAQIETKGVPANQKRRVGHTKKKKRASAIPAVIVKCGPGRATRMAGAGVISDANKIIISDDLSPRVHLFRCPGYRKDTKKDRGETRSFPNSFARRLSPFSFKGFRSHSTVASRTYTKIQYEPMSPPRPADYIVRSGSEGAGPVRRKSHW